MNNINFSAGNPRKYVYYGLIAACMLVLSIGFYHLQIMQESIYRGKSEKNSVKKVTQIPVRGHIYDRNWGTFHITDSVLDSLMEDGVPYQARMRLEKIKQKIFPTEESFLDTLRKTIGNNLTQRHRPALLKYAQIGKLIVDNRPSFSLYLVPALTTRPALEALGAILEVAPEQISKNFRRSRRFQPVKIARYVTLETLVKLQENRLQFPGLEWKVEPKRNYYFRSSFAHVLGTLGEIGENELSQSEEYEAGDVVGKKGIEKGLDKELRGQKGFKFVKVDALGRTVEDLSPRENALPHPGKDLFLTIDARLQQYADSLFGDRNGAFVAVDPRNGEILTMVSKPDYDLNLFAEAVKPEVWQELMSDSLKPLYDRATQATYPPGSTYKMVAAIAGLNEGIITPQWTIFCPGYYRIGRRTVHCWNAAGHGEVNITAAIRGSCNVFFYQLGLKLGIEQWTKYSRIFQFGKPCGIELTSEKAGLVPSRAYYDRIYGKGKWTNGMLANIAIGQGELLVTPLQMAQFAMILANSGRYYRPHLTRKLVDKIPAYQVTEEALKQLEFQNAPQEILNLLRGLKERQFTQNELSELLETRVTAEEGQKYEPSILEYARKIFPPPDRVSYPAEMIEGIQPEVFEIIREGMRQVVAGGTGWRAGVWQKSGAGKTGTAQNPHGDSHAWFIGFTPFEEPEIAVAVIFENGGSGSGVAAPVVGQYLQRYYYYKGEFDYQKYREFQRMLWEKQKEKARQDSLQGAGIQLEPLNIRSGN